MTTEENNNPENKEEQSAAGTPEEQNTEQESIEEKTSDANAPEWKNNDAQAGDNEAMKEKVADAIRTVFDPEIPVNVYDLGLIYEINIMPVNNVQVVMTLTSPSCPSAEELPGMVEEAVRSIQDVNDVYVELTFDPPFTPEMMSDEAKLMLGFM